MRRTKILLLILMLGAAMAVPAQERTATATFAGGCFWCMEGPFDKLDGVLSTTSGYAGGHVKVPSYKQVSSGRTGHAEAVRIVYDPARIGFAELLRVYWRNVDPLDGGGQFCDRGTPYRPVVFYNDEEQRLLAEGSRREVAGRFSAPVAATIEPFSTFYPAEDYHQDYYQRNPVRYKFYRTGCGRDARLRDLWGDEAGGAR